MAKTEKKVSIALFDKIAKEHFQNEATIQWHEAEVRVKRTLSLKEMLSFVDEVVGSCFHDELGYMPGDTETKREICGRNMALGLPALLEITADFVATAISEQLKAIVDAIKMILERTPPELGVDIIRNGIYLTGGVANLKGLDELIAKATNIRVNMVDRPEECVARGLERVIKEKEFKSLAFVTKEQVYN